MNYLDWAATAIPEEEIILQATKEACKFFANPSSKHTVGKRASEMVEASRKEIAGLFGITADKLFFTSGGTEANHIPLLSMLNLKTPMSIAISCIEHPSVKEQAKILEKNGFKILRIPVDKHGFITPESVLNTIQSDTALVSVMTVNNETGSIQPIKEIGLALKKYSEGKRPIFFHSDTVQAVGKIPLNFSELPIDGASFSAHKIGGPRGIGFVYLAKNINVFLRGGGQENNIRPGTENLGGILAMKYTLQKYISHQKEYLSNVKKLMNYLITELNDIDEISLVPELRKTNPENFSPWVLQFANQSLPGEVLQRCLSDRQIFVSTGSACSSKHKIDTTAKKIQIDPKIQKNIVRISFGRTTTIDDVKDFVNNLKEILKEF